MILALLRDGETTRGRLQALIASHPGINIRELAVKADLAWSTVAYHVTVLRRRHAVHATKAGRDFALFAGFVPTGAMRALRVLHDEDAGRVLLALLTPKGVVSLSAELGLSHKVIRKHLGRLMQAGLVEKKGEYRPRYVGVQIPVQEGLDRGDGSDLEPRG